jgi:aquaporin Z
MRAAAETPLNWPEYVIEAAGLALFMISACVFGTLLGHPGSPVVGAVPDPLLRRVLMGTAMGLTAIGLISSPWGQRSGAHFNPATTLTFWRLGKVRTRDAGLYAGAHVLGGVAGVAVAAALLRDLVAHPAVRYVATVPGAAGTVAAFGCEVALALGLMWLVLRVSNTAGLARFTPLVVGAVVASYITVAAPISGMSMNPARSVASAVFAGTWSVLWIYLVAPPIGMLLAAEVYAWRPGVAAVFCAKLHHHNAQPCIFRCRHDELRPRVRQPVTPSAEPAPVAPRA